MAWYDTGTVAVTNGSTTVTGTGTNFITGAQIGEAFYGPDDKLYEIASITSATVLVLADNYLGSTQSGQGYKIVPTQSLVADLASDVTDLIADYADVKDKAGAGKFNDGSVTAPAITFEQDQNNGLYRIGSDNYGLSAGGTKQIDISTTDVELNYSGSKKLATTATGVDVTGTVTADGLTVDDGGIGTATDSIKIKSGWSSPSGLKSIAFEDQSSNTIGQFGVSYSGGVGSFEIDSLYNSGNNSNKVFKVSAGGDVSFYEDTGTTAKMVWDASAECLRLGATSSLGKLSIKQDSDTTTGGLLIGSTDGAAGAISRLTSGAMVFRNNVIDTMYLKSGNVGIGTASPSYTLDILATTAQARIESTSGNALLRIQSTDTGESKIYFGDTTGNAVGRIEYEHLNDSMRFHTDNTERARIDSSGNLLVGTTLSPIDLVTSTSITGFGYDANDYLAIARDGNPLILNRVGSDGSITSFSKDGVIVGSISVTGSATSYNTSSDERLKENIKDTTHTTDIDDIKVREFDWKLDGSHQRYGFIAQELEVVYPEAVTRHDSDDEMMSVDYSKLVPLLVKEIQQLKTRIEALEAKL